MTRPERHGENLFDDAQQARSRLENYGFYPLHRMGNAEHFVRGSRRVVLAYEGDIPSAVPLDSATGVFFVECGDFVICDFE